MAGAAVSACSLSVALIALRSLRITPSVCRQGRVPAAFIVSRNFASRKCVISGFRRGVVQILALLGRYAAACSGSY